MAIEGLRDSTFLSIITPVSVEDNLLYLPVAFVTKHGNGIPWRCFLRVCNGDFFEVIFIKKKNAFVGVKTILQRYRTTTYCFIVLKYLGGADFAMELFSCYAVEVEYPLPGISISLLRESIFYRNRVFEPTAGAHHFTLLEDMEYELLRFNCMRNNGVSFEIKLTSPEMLSDEPGLFLSAEHVLDLHNLAGDSFVKFQVGYRFWTVQMHTGCSGIYFKTGWEIVVGELGLQVGDLCVFRAHNSLCNYRLAIFKEREMLCRTIRPGSLFGRRFVILATERSISVGEIYLPRLFMQICGTELKTELLVVHSSGKNCTATYNVNSHTLLGLGGLVRSLSTEIGDLYLFKFTVAGLFNLTVIKEGAPQVLF